MKSILIVCLCMWGLLVYGEKNNTVHLYGSLKEFKAAEVNMAPDGAAGEISDAGVIKIPVDADGNFDLVLPLSKPAYFRIGRNTLYLTPGDELKVYLGTSQPQSTFEGKGMEANTYLKGRLFPKAGSFLSAGRNLKPTFEATKKTVDSLAALRMKELEELKNVSKEFKLFEKERIKADVANSYMSFAGYSDAMWSDCKSEEEFNRVVEKFYTSIQGDMNPILREIAGSDDYLDVAVVRDVLVSCYNLKAFDYPKSARLAELVEVLEKGEELEGELTPEKYRELKDFAGKLKNKDFSEAYLERLERRAKLMEGRPAIDLDLVTSEGKKGKLSDYKGKPMYVDFWATWCGPCMGEMPYFNELSRKYPNVQFIGISVDESEKAWKNFIGQGSHGAVNELNCQDSRTKSGWDITGIPRFLLIDEHFNIISADAPRPSQKEIIEPILRKVSKK